MVDFSYWPSDCPSRVIKEHPAKVLGKCCTQMQVYRVKVYRVWCLSRLLLIHCLDAGRVMQESVALDTSHESSRGTTRLPSPEVSLDNEEFSDWDSWEDENEVQVWRKDVFPLGRLGGAGAWHTVPSVLLQALFSPLLVFPRRGFSIRKGLSAFGRNTIGSYHGKEYFFAGFFSFLRRT